MKIRLFADASLPGLKTAFPSPFVLTLYHNQDELSARLAGQNVLLCRSTLAVNQALLSQQSLDIVATASSGRDHLDEAYLAQEGIQIIDAKGCNAASVADYVLCSLAYLRKNLEFKGSKVGIIGAGAVGSLVAARLAALGFNVICYDPLKALYDSQFIGADYHALFDCDLLCIHANRHASEPHPSVDLINADFLKHLKPGTAIINAARGGIVNETDLLSSDPSIIYCTDVYANEPAIDPLIVQRATLCTPHIAGHSIEAKQRAIDFISQQLHTHYQAPYQSKKERQSPQSPPIQIQTWEAQCLALYNPLYETQCLKTAKPPLETSFLSTRKAHTKRHDFDYEPPN